MAGALIGALKVSLGIDSAQFSAGLKGASGNLDKFAKAAAVGFAAITAAATGAFLAIRSAADRADDAWKASQSIGIPIKDLGRLSYAAEMSGASFETLQTGVRKVSQNIAKAVKGGGGEASKAFKDLGVSVRNSDGTLRSASDVIGDVAEVFSKMPDGVQKTSAAMDLFGKSGASLIPTLNMGRQGLKDMGDEAERMGLVFDEKTARSAETFNDNLMRLNLSFTGLWNRVLTGVIPAFEGLSNKIVATVQNGQFLDIVIGAITVGMNLLTKGIGFVVDNLDFLINLFKVFVAAKLITFMAGVVGAFITFAKTVRVAGIAMAVVTSITKLKITAILLLGAAIAQVTGTLQDMVTWVEGVGKSLAAALPEELRNGIDSLSDGIFNLGTQIDEVDSTASNSLATYLRIGSEAPGAFGAAAKGATAVGQAVADTDTKAKGLADTLSAVGNGISSAFSGLIKDGIRGADVVGGLLDKVGQLGDSLIDMAFNQAINGFLGMLVGSFGGSGLGSGAIGRGTYGGTGGFFPAFPSFAGGGFTGSGSRSGGVDGRGGFPALLHPNETVVDHTRGGADGGLSMTFNISGSKQDAAEIARVARQEALSVVQQYQQNPYRR